MNRPALEPPAARQGPGPIPHALVEMLDLALAKRTAHARSGDRRSPGTGDGVELAQLRPYVMCDDVRHLDPAATARTGEPHVRLQVPDRALTTWIALDLSPSMAFGTARRLKADVAHGVALVLGRLAIRRGGGLGVVAFGAGTARVLRPRSSRPALVALTRLLSEGVAADGSRDPHALLHALRQLETVARQPGLVAVISDFRELDDWQRAIGGLRRRHAVVAVEVSDPRESELPAVGRLALVDPESGRRIEVDTSSRRLRERFAAIERTRREELRRELGRLRVEHVALSTGGDWPAELGRALR